MTIEEEFFKAINIPTRFYTTVNVGDLDTNYQEQSANTLQELFQDNAFWIDPYIEDIKDFQDWEEKYPPITPEIVLGLIAICSGLFPMSFAFERGANEIRENTLKACIWASKKDDLKGYIQDQVKELFNGK